MSTHGYNLVIGMAKKPFDTKMFAFVLNFLFIFTEKTEVKLPKNISNIPKFY